MSWHKRRAAHYCRFDAGYESYGKSYNASCAEENGRLPLTRAAYHLGVNTVAFRVGCAAADYKVSEWHHVGKFATPVDYYDTNELSSNPEFWKGCSEAYKSKIKKEELLMKAHDISLEVVEI